MRVRLLENDFYERFQEVFDRIAALDPPVDLVVHAGDLYDSPWEGNPSQPPVVAQETALSVIKGFIEKTGIPVLIIEGNHGLYRTLDVSLLDSLDISVDTLKVATQVDLKRALSAGKPLKFSYDELDVFCFPFLDYSVLESANLVTDFNDWITTYQKPDSKRPSIAVAHGMELDQSLFGAIFSMNYDYIALGHDHHLHKHSDKAWYAGSPERWRFDEVRHEKGFLEVDIKHGEKPEVTKHILEYDRPVLNNEIEIEVDDTVQSVLAKIQDCFAEKGFDADWDPKTAARVRLVFKGDSPRFSGLDLTVAMESMRVDVLSPDSNYNISQLVWSIKQKDIVHDPAAYPEIESEYLIEDPRKDFESYLDTLKIGVDYDADILTKVAVRALEFAVGRDEGSFTIDTLSTEGSD
jgi:DNA repair exonuclease SbcCD nuclease subunit